MIINIDAQPLITNQKTGIGFCLAETLRALQKLYPHNDYRLSYFDFPHSNQKESALRPFFTVKTTPNRCSWFPGKIYRVLWNVLPVPYRWFFGKSAQVNHFFNYHVPPGVHGKIVTTVHDMAYKVFPETVRLKTKIMLNISLVRSCRRANRIITDSQFSKDEIQKYLDIPPEKITVSPCGVDTSRFYPVTDTSVLHDVAQRLNIPGDYILYLGTLEPRKNIERLIEAYAALKADKPEAPFLVVAGRKGWLYGTIFSRVKQLGLTEQIIFTGYVTDEDIPVLLSGAVAFLFPSLYEGFGMPPLEAMACGTPVLTSNCSSLPEVVADAAVLVDPYSVENIRAGMERLIYDGALRLTLSEKGRARAKTFSWERSAKIVMDVYKQLLEEDC